ARIPTPPESELAHSLSNDYIFFPPQHLRIRLKVLHFSLERASSLINELNSVGDKELRRICIALLGWLSSRARFPRMKSMSLSELGSACESMIDLLQRDSSFSVIFILGEDGVEFHKSLRDDEIAAMCQLAEQLHKPPRFVSKKRM
ncbi:hypothetical protein, partial [Parachitinimonas caeni]